MRWIVGSSIRFRLLVIPIAAAMMVFGVAQLRDAPADVLPEFAAPRVEVQTEALGLSASEVEQLVTVPLEADLLNGVAWLDQIRSESVSGLSSIELIFEPGTDVMRARQMVQERLTGAIGLPHVSKPPVMIQPLSSTSRVVMVGLSSKDLSLIEMSVLARWKIKPRLMGVPGVANVAIWGQRERQLQVQVDPARLRANGVSLNQVIKTTGNALWVSPLSFVEASTPGTGGFIDTPNQRLGIQHISPIKAPKDLAQVTLEDTEGKRLRLGDVAGVVEDHQPLIGDGIVNDNASLMLVIEKFPGSSTVDVTKDVEAALDALRPGLSDIEIDTSLYRPATFIESALGNLTATLIVALLLVILLLGAFLFDWRAALICVITIPLALLAAGVALHLGGVTFNLLVLAGLLIALGVVIDDAIVDVDNIRRRLRAHRASGGEKSSVDVIVEASLQMRGTLLYATVIALVAVVPAFFLTGVMGAFSRPLVVSYAVAVVASMVVALTVTPALALLLFARARLDRSEPLLTRWVRRGYGAVLVHTTQRPLRAILGGAVVALAGLAVLPQLGGNSMVPSLQDRDVLIHWEGAPGTSHPEMNRITAMASRELRSVSGVRNVGGHVGRAITSDQVVGINTGELWVNIDPKADFEATTAAINKVIAGYPGLHREVLSYPEERIRKALTGSDEALVVRIYGQDLDVLRAEADEVRQAISRIEGVVGPRVDLPAEEPTVEIEVDLAAAEEHAIKPGDVRRSAATLLSGIQVGNLFEDQKVFDVVVWGAPAIRNSLNSIEELQIDTPDGDQVRLGDVAEVRVVPHSTVIKRDAVSRYVDVAANVRGRELSAVVNDVDEVLGDAKFPVEYHAELLGQYAEGTDDQGRSVGLAIAAAIAIFLFLQAAFGSWRLATAFLLALPLALAGGALAAFAAGDIISLGSLIGLVTILAIAVRGGTLLIRHYQHLEQDEGEPFGLGLVIRGSQERLVPTVMTALATALAVLPLVVLGSVPGQEIAYPVAVVILGGLVMSTLLTLFVVPALYLLFGSGTAGAADPQTTSHSG
jgi:CzcA family heavy metal efflux pump